MNSNAGENGCYQTQESLALKGSFLSSLYQWLTEVKWMLFQKDTFGTRGDSLLLDWLLQKSSSTQALLQGWCLSPKKNQFIKFNTFISVAECPLCPQQLVGLDSEHAGSLCHMGLTKIHPGTTTGTWKGEGRYRHTKHWNKETLPLPVLVKIKW